jgi:hypothetical protein
MGEKRTAYRIWVGNPEGKRPLGRPRCRWVDNIKMDLREMGWYGLDRYCSLHSVLFLGSMRKFPVFLISLSLILHTS